MTLKKSKPTSPGQRAVVRSVNSFLYKGNSYSALTEKKKKKFRQE